MGPGDSKPEAEGQSGERRRNQSRDQPIHFFERGQAIAQLGGTMRFDWRS